MAASACLRILLDLTADKLARLDALGPLVTKVTEAFLSSRWVLPKRHVVLTPYSFMLTDPLAEQLDVARLERLATELKVRLFGGSEAGEVTLLLHDGDEKATALFATIDQAYLKKAAKDSEGPLPFSGRLMTISTAADMPSSPDWRAINCVSGPDSGQGQGGARPDRVFHGIYHRINQCFVGSGVDAAVAPSGIEFSVFGAANQLPGDSAIEFDTACVRAAAKQLAKAPWSGALFVPVCFSAAARPATREAYEAAFQSLPADKRHQLVAVVYDVPRLPPRHVFVHLQDLVGPRFSQIDLQISDPGFDLDLAPSGVVNIVTLRLPEGDDMIRLAAIRRFLERKSSFKRLNIAAAFANVRTCGELEACLKAPTTYVSGEAVCGAQQLPIGNLPADPDHLPLVASRSH